MQEHAHAGQATTATALTSSKCTSNSAVVRMQNNTAHVVLARNAHAQTLAGIGSKQKRTYSYSLQTLGVSDHPSDAAIWDLRRSSWAWTTRGLRVPNKGNRGNAHVGMMSIWRVRLPRRQTRHDTTFNVCTDDGNLEETSRKQAADCTYVRRQRRSSGRLADVAASSNREAATRITVEGVWGVGRRRVNGVSQMSERRWPSDESGVEAAGGAVATCRHHVDRPKFVGAGDGFKRRLAP